MSATIPQPVSISNADPNAMSHPQATNPVVGMTAAAAGGVPVTTQEGVGTEGEVNVWEARYSMRNFLFRGIGLAVLTVAWLGLALYTWEPSLGGNKNLAPLTWISGITLLVCVLLLLRRLVIVRFSHYYRLTNRRLFVSSGLFVRRRDQMELLRVQDVYTRQTLMQRWLSLGTVVVVSTEPHLPILYITGVDDPKGVMDLIWHYARSERDKRSVKVDAI